MNCAVGSRETPSPMERRRRIPLAVKGAVTGLAVAALVAGATLVNAQNSTPAAQPAPATAPAAKKSTSGATAGSSKEKGTATAGAETPKSKGSYAIGVSVGENLRRAKVAADAVSVEKIAQGIRDSLAGKAEMSQEYQAAIMSLIQGARVAAAEPNHKAAEAFLAENGKKKDVVTTASGLQYKVLTPGSGEPPKPTDQVSVNYRGTLLDGTEFDASAKHGGPATFNVNGVIPGWTEALQLMKPGAKYQLWIPPKLAYDLDSPPVIPPGSLLVFDVELLSVKPPAAGSATPTHPAIPPSPKQ
jgi:FKBP-type peptidyl-prolyl cis-trans isomerase